MVTKLVTHLLYHNTEGFRLDRRETAECLHEVLTTMLRDRELVGEQDFVYLPWCYNTEGYLAERLAARLRTKVKGQLGFHREAVRQVDLGCDRNGNPIQLNDAQLDAAAMGLLHWISLLTGCPGTGKTSALRAMVTVAHERGERILLACPTGKGADRMFELTGHAADTVHTMLGVDPESGGFLHNESHPLEADLLVIDEGTMLDDALAEAVLRATPTTCRMVVVGDVDQLPSVGKGRVFGDLLDSDQIPMIRLVDIWRTAEGSSIALAAQSVRNGIVPDWAELDQTEVRFVHHPKSIDLALHLIGRAVTVAKRQQIPPEEVQILVPMNKGRGGTHLINFYYQVILGRYWLDDDNYFQPVAEHLDIGPRAVEQAYQEEIRRMHDHELGSAVDERVRLFVGDRVIHTKNNKVLQIRNGVIGIVESLDTVKGSLVVRYRGRAVAYDRTQVAQLALAYGLSVHKFMGSESEAVILGCHHVYGQMLERSGFYTGLSRARRMLEVVGDHQGIASAVRTTTANDRHTRLALRLREAVHARYL